MSNSYVLGLSTTVQLHGFALPLNFWKVHERLERAMGNGERLVP